MPSKKIFQFEKTPQVSIIIPSLDGNRDGNVAKLINDIKNQSFKSVEIIISINEKPNGRARNVGFEKVCESSEYLIFFDDDVTLGNNLIIENFIKVLKNKKIGLVGASQLPPKNSSLKQLWIGYDLKRAKFKIVKKITETDMVTHAGMACRREIWETFDGESNSLVTGTDTDLRERISNKGYKNVVSPNTFVYHPLPKNFSDVFKTAIFHGKYQYSYRKERGYQDSFTKPFKKINTLTKFIFFLFIEILIFFPHIFLTKRKIPFGFRPINALFRLLMVTSYLKETYIHENKFK